MDAFSDEELVERYRAAAGRGEGSRCIDELFARHYTRAGAWCYRMTGDRESAADLAQEVFAKAYRHLGSFRGDSKFSTWLYTIARNHCTNEMKSRASEPPQAPEELLAELASTGSDPGQAWERAQAAALLRELLSSLDEVEAKIVKLHYLDELPVESVTRLLGLENASGAKAYLVSARRKLSAAVQRWKARAGAGVGRPHHE
jgi:RNA polymerase sigma-70 factor (ECF subfamily)